MNLEKLFALQAQADEPWKYEPNRLEKDILWLQVELGELANEWRGFKYRYPVREQLPRTCVTDWDALQPLRAKPINPLLEEYTDGLQVILSIGLGMKDIIDKVVSFQATGGVLQQFLSLNKHVGSMQFAYEVDLAGSFETENFKHKYIHSLSLLLGLGEMLELQWEDIERCYEEKIERNKERQGTT